MRDESFHPSDQDLLLFADGELPKQGAADLRLHLLACWRCRARLTEFESTISDFIRATRRDLDSDLPPIAAPRSLLRARLAQLSASLDTRPWWQLRFRLHWRDVAQALAILFLLTIGARALSVRTAGREPRILEDSFAGLLPNPSLTPGSSQPTSVAKLCSMNHEEVVSTIPTELQSRVFQEYGMSEARAADYEVDYLITPGLGGSDDIRNLWPQPHAAGAWNSHVKDQLEDRLHSLVCAGEVDLATAQQEIATDWISAYKKYFHTNAPVVPSFGRKVHVTPEYRDMDISVLLEPGFILRTPS